MMVFGEERLFLLEGPPACQSLSEIFLRYMGVDNKGIKMKGNFAPLWSIWRDRIIGPNLFDEEYAYRVLGFDYNIGLLWLTKL